MTTVKITTAGNFDDALYKKLCDGIENKHGECRFEHKTDDSILGGFIVENDGIIYDYSLRSKLSRMGSMIDGSMKVD